MRVLLDECLPRKQKAELVGHEVRTAPDMGWAGKRDKDLLTLAATQFEVFITVDRSIAYQQNLANVSIGILTLSARSNRIEDLRPLVPQIVQALSGIRPGVIVRVG